MKLPVLPLWALAAALTLLLLSPSRAQTTTTDDFTTQSNWTVVRVSSPATTLAVGNGRMNYTTTSSGVSGAIATWNGPKLPANQNWSLAADAHIDAFAMASFGQFVDMFLGVARTSDVLNTNVLLEFDRGNWGAGLGYDIGDDITVSGSDVTGILNEYNLTTPDVSLRMDYNAAARTLTYYIDANGAAGGYSWVTKGTLQLGPTFDTIGLLPTETFTVMLVGSSELQTVVSGTAYLSNLRATVGGTLPSAPEIAVEQPAGTVLVDGSASVAFGNTNVGTTSVKTFTIRNLGPLDLTGLALSKDGPNSSDFTLGPLGAISLAPGASTTFTVTFSPGSEGTKSAAIHISSNDSDENPFDITLSGTATPPPYTYTTDGGEVTITGYTGSGGAITIPAIINGLPVVSIGYSAFSSKSSMTSVMIPNSVTYIENYAFYNCYGLTSVTIPNSVTYIGVGAFEYCSRLTSMTIPNSVSSIENYAFKYCSGLTSVTIPNSVTSIGNEAFYYCSGLTGVTIPNSITSIGYGAFYNCYGLTSVTIPNSVTYISSYVFASCSGLASVTIPNSVTSIGNEAFKYCSGLTSVTIPNSVTYIWDDAFSYCSGLTSVTIPNSVTYIYDYAFDHCSGLTSVTIPNSVTYIGYSAFGRCSALTQISVDSLNSYYSSLDGVLFSKDLSLLIAYPGGKQGVYNFPNSVTSIGEAAFSGSGLTSVTIPNSVTYIGSFAFSGCSGLTSVTIPNSVKSIRDWAFAYCSGLTRAQFAGNAPTMGGAVFGYAAGGFKVYFLNGSTGFTTPTWNGYPSVNMGGSSSTVTWLLAYGLPYNADLQSDPNKDGVPLAVEYGFGLNPGVFNANPGTSKVESSRLALDFSIPEVIPAGVRIYVEEAAALNGWQVIASKISGGAWTMEDGATASEAAVVSGRLPVTVRSGHLLSESAMRFIRLGVELPQPTAP